MSARQLIVLRGRLWIHPHGDVHAHGVRLGPAGYLHAYGSPGRGDGADADRWLTQHCRRHDTPDVIDCETPELRRFDFVRGSAHIKAHRTDVAYDDEKVTQR